MPEQSAEVAAAIDLAFGSGPPDALQQADATRLTRLLKRNLVPTAALDADRLDGAPVVGPELQTYLQNDRRRLEENVDAFSEVTREWDARGIRSVLIKSPGYFPYTSSNVDVLVSPDDAHEARRALVDLGYLELKEMREPYKWLYRRIKLPHWGFPIHVHTDVAWINRFLSGAEVLRDSSPQEHAGFEFRAPSPEHSILITTAHWFYEDKELKLRDLYHVWRAVSAEPDWDRVLDRVAAGGWESSFALALDLTRWAAGELGVTSLSAGIPPSSEPRPAGHQRVFDHVVANETEPPFRLPRIFCKRAHLQKAIRDGHASPTEKLTDAYRIVAFAVKVKAKKAHRGKPFIASVSGLDGSGKTTLARGIEAGLTEDFDLPVKYEWARPASSPVLEVVKSGVVRLTRRPGAAAPTADAEGGRAGGGREMLRGRPRLRSLWAYMVITDFIARVWIQVGAAKLRGGVHVFDRYATDAVADLVGFYEVTPPAWLMRSIPRADFRIFIRLDTQTSIERASTPVSLEYLENAADTYSLHGKDADLQLDGNDDPRQLTEEALRALLVRYEAEQ